MANSTESLSKKLWKLSSAIEAAVEKYRTEGLATLSKVAYIRPKITNFDFKEGSNSMGWTNEYVEKDEMRLRTTLDMLDSTKSLLEYKEVVKTIAGTYHVHEAQADFWLSIFATRLSTLHLNKQNHGAAVDLITTFIADLEGSPKLYRLSIWLTGIWNAQDDEVSLGEGAILRRPRPEDFVTERPVELAVGFIWNDPLDFGSAKPSAVLEFERRAKDQLELQRDIETILVILRLFRVGAIINVRIQWSVKSVTQFSNQVSGGQRILLPGENFSVSVNDKVAEFVQALKPLIPQELITGGEKLDFLVTSVQRYHDALLKPEPAESRITLAMMSLEALYLKVFEKELTHRMSQRIARVLENLGIDALETYKLLNRAYRIRSKFVHGEPLDKKEREYSLEALSKVLDFARLSIVIFLQLNAKTTKESFLDLVDISLLSDSAKHDLDSKMKEWVVIRPLASGIRK